MTHAWSCFLHCMGPVDDGQLEVSPHLNHLQLLHGAVVAMETVQLALNPHQAFQTQSIRN